MTKLLFFYISGLSDENYWYGDEKLLVHYKTNFHYTLIESFELMTFSPFILRN